MGLFWYQIFHRITIENIIARGKFTALLKSAPVEILGTGFYFFPHLSFRQWVFFTPLSTFHFPVRISTNDCYSSLDQNCNSNANQLWIMLFCFKKAYCEYKKRATAHFQTVSCTTAAVKGCVIEKLEVKTSVICLKLHS